MDGETESIYTHCQIKDKTTTLGATWWSSSFAGSYFLHSFGNHFAVAFSPKPELSRCFFFKFPTHLDIKH